MLFLVSIDEVLDSFEVVGREDRDLKVVLEARCEDLSQLVGYWVLVSPLEIGPQLGLISETLLRSHSIEVLAQRWISIDVHGVPLSPHRLRCLLSCVFGRLLHDAGAACVALVIRLAI